MIVPREPLSLGVWSLVCEV